MGMNKFSELGSFEEMAEQNEQKEAAKVAPATENVATEAKTEEAPVATDVKVDNVETPKTN
jgi:hypothetical protein